MSGATTRLSLYKPGGGSDGILPDEAVDIGKINGNMDAIDAAIGAPGYTSTSRPSTPFDGQLIKETDTKRIMRYSQAGSIWEEAVSPTQGLTTIKPTVTSSGGTVTLVGNKIVFTNVNSFSVNGCFTALFDNYALELITMANPGSGDITMLLRAAGSDIVSPASYDNQRIYAVNGGAVNAPQVLNVATGWSLSANTSAFLSEHIDIYSPAVARGTYGQAQWASMGGTMSNGSVGFYFNSNNQADGFTLKPAGGGTFSGELTIYGKGM